MSCDFDFDSPKRRPTATQYIAPDSSDDEEPTRIGPTQGVWSQEGEEIAPNSPVFPSRKRQKTSDLRPEDPPSPVYESPLPRISLLQAYSGLSQKIESCSSTQSPPPISRQESTHISTPTSSDSTLGNSQPEYTSFRAIARPTRKRRPKKNGLVEKLVIAQRRAASNESLNSHLPSNLRGNSDIKKSGKVLEVCKTFSSLTLKCLDYKLDPATGERNVFKIIAASNLQVTKGCDVRIQGPWQTFNDHGNQVYCQVSKISVIQNDKKEKEYELQMGDSDHESDDITIPRAAMNKMIKELCPQIRVANEARELILNCCTEFIHLVSSEANDICNNQQKKTINAEHVLLALEKLGYGDFRKDAEDALQECKEVAAKRKRQSTRLEHMGIPEEELLRQQQELFAKAKAEAAKQEQQLLQQQQSTTSDTTNQTVEDKD